MKRFTVVAAGAVLASVLATGWAVAQSAAEGVRLYSPEELTFAQYLRILARGAVPGSRVVAPLHAYESDLACVPAREVALLEHDGSAALVAEFQDTVFAFYYRTAGQAVRVARARGWCPTESSPETARVTPPPWAQDAESWFLATTLPVPGEEAVHHYLSMDVDRVDASIERGDAEARAYVGDLADNSPEP